MRYLIQAGAKSSINQTGNSALACVLRHVRDWDICYELLNMLLNEGGEFIYYKRARIASLTRFDENATVSPTSSKYELLFLHFHFNYCN